MLSKNKAPILNRYNGAPRIASNRYGLSSITLSVLVGTLTLTGRRRTTTTSGGN